MFHSSPSLRSFLLLAFGCALCLGCGSGKSGWEITHPVSGGIKFKGSPLADAELALFPEGNDVPESVRPKAKSTAGGKFVVWTYAPDDGAPAGKYKVTVVHQEVAVSKDTIVTKPNKLPPKYSRRDLTDLTVTISAGNNELPVIDLK